jgi:hypothetical protein
VYRVVVDDQVQSQLDALSPPALAAFGELQVLLELNPWAGGPVNPANCDGPVRTMSFGPSHEGVAAYLILEEQRRVDLVPIAWLG